MKDRSVIAILRRVETGMTDAQDAAILRRLLRLHIRLELLLQEHFVTTKKQQC